MEQYLSFRSNPVAAFIWRLKEDMASLSELFAQVSAVASYLDLEEIKNRVLNTEMDAGSQLFMNRHKLRRQLVILTESNVIYSIDSSDGSIQWRHYLPPFTQAIQLQEGDTPDVVVYTYRRFQEGGVAHYAQELKTADGSEASPAQQMPSEGQLTFIVPSLAQQTKTTDILESETHENAKIVLNLEDQTISSTSSVQVNAIRVTRRGIQGYEVQEDGRYAEVWTVGLGDDETLIDYSYHLKGQQEYFR